jgi:SAM-dependent methyltransferase
MQTFGNVEAIISHLDNLEGAAQRQAMFETVLEPKDIEALAQLDPFSTEYKAKCTEIYEAIAERPYNPTLGELMPGETHYERNAPSPPFSFGDSAALGDYFLAWGGILRVLNIKAGMSVLELGPGDGHISVALARMHCDVYALDIEPRYLQGIEAQAERFGVKVTTKLGLFLDGFDGRKFDRILFFEAFHHELHHDLLLERLRGMLNPGGFIVFSGEPIIERGNPMVPYCWGPRMDGMSVWCMNKHGWFELGFERGYFVELLMRHGFAVTRWMNPAAGIGNCFIATPNDGVIEPGKHEVDIARGDSGWYPEEGSHRWTWQHARIPIDQANGWRQATLRATNHTPARKPVTFRSGRHEATIKTNPGETFEIRIDLDPEAQHLEILTDTTVPSKFFGGQDGRALGVAVHQVEYTA